MTKRRSLYVFTAGVIVFLLFWGTIVAPRWFEVTRTDIPLFTEALKEPIVVLHLSDFHYCEKDSLQSIICAIDLGIEAAPDVIFLTGDFIGATFREPEPFVTALKRLSDVAPVYACPGNHDGGSWAMVRRGYSTVHKVHQLLEKSNIHLLVNEYESMVIKGRRFRIVGIGDLWSGEYRPSGDLFLRSPEPIQSETNQKGVTQETKTIVLSHNPDTKNNLIRYDWDLMLSGHTHGGQVVIPFLGAPFAPVKDKTVTQGLHKFRGRYLYVTRGVGSIAGFRLNCSPEVTILKIH